MIDNNSKWYNTLSFILFGQLQKNRYVLLILIKSHFPLNSHWKYPILGWNATLTFNHPGASDSLRYSSPDFNQEKRQTEPVYRKQLIFQKECLQNNVSRSAHENPQKLARMLCTACFYRVSKWLRSYCFSITSNESESAWCLDHFSMKRIYF